MSITFWKKETGNLMNAKQGLTAEQIEFLQSLKQGDRLILWFENQKSSDNSPDFRMKKYAKEKPE